MIGKRQLFLVGDVPAGKLLRLSTLWHWNFFLLSAKAELFRFAFDNFRIVLQVIDLLLQTEIVRSHLFYLRTKTLVLFDLA